MKCINSNKMSKRIICKHLKQVRMINIFTKKSRIQCLILMLKRDLLIILMLIPIIIPRNPI
jgi:hypothetical protein